MFYRIREKIQQIENERRDWKKQSRKCEFSLQPAGRNRYKRLKKEEYNRIWFIEKEHKTRKLDRFPGIPEFFQGVGLGEECLEREFGNPQIEPIVLGGIQASENMKAFLRKPLKFRVFPKILLKDNKVEAEASSAKK